MYRLQVSVRLKCTLKLKCLLLLSGSTSVSMVMALNSSISLVISNVPFQSQAR